jgi:hypothetical protein
MEGKPVTVRLSPRAAIVYDRLALCKTKEDRALYDALQMKLGHIKEDHRYGRPVPKRLIPERYRREYGLSNLFRVELPFFWRMLYAVEGDEITIVAFIADIVSHEEYDGLFGYKK